MTALRETPCRVLLVDEHAAVHRGVAAMLAADPAVSLVAAATSAREAVELVALHRPDVVLLDHDLSGASGLEACLAVKTSRPDARVLLYCDSVDEELVAAAVVAGVDGVLGTEADAEALCATLRATARGVQSLPPVSPRTLGAAGGRLDPADLPIFAMLRHGTPPADIAAALRVGVRRIAVRRWAMLERLLGGAAPPPAAAPTWGTP
jgi:DNA-binding NarL/FixJ family response regulator